MKQNSTRCAGAKAGMARTENKERTNSSSGEVERKKTEWRGKKRSIRNCSGLSSCRSYVLLAKLEKFQNRGHRLICGYSSCSCGGFPSLLQKLEAAAVSILRQAEENAEHPLHRFVPERLPATQKLRLPVSNTSRRLNSFIVSASLLVNCK